MPDFDIESEMGAQAGRIVAGVDEAGRGPWAGPVVAGAAIIDMTRVAEDLVKRLDDSKKLKRERREHLLERMQNSGAVTLGIGVAGVAEIDRLNILQATYLAMRRAVSDLGVTPDVALIDGNRVPPELPCQARAVVKGDGKSLSIAAASIAAKVTRDWMMEELDRAFPGYGWANNAGYGTKQHQQALLALGVTEHHRKSFAPIRKILSPDES